MKKLKNLFVMLVSTCFVAFIAFQCSKEQISSCPNKNNNSNIANAFIPLDEEAAKTNVLSIVSKLNTSGIQSRTETPDMPVDEARWSLEASGNYLWNRNITGRKTDKVLGMKVELTCDLVSGQPYVDGSELSAKFAYIAQTFYTGLENGQLLGGIDVTIDTIKPDKTELTVRAIVMSQQNLNCSDIGLQSDPSFTTSSLNYISYYTGVCVNANIPNIVLNQGCLFSDLFIVSYIGAWFNPNTGAFSNIVAQGYGPNGTGGRPCTNNNARCLAQGYEWEPFPLGGLSAEQFVSNQATIAMQIFNDTEQEFLALPSGQAYADGTLRKVGLDVGMFQTQVLDPNMPVGGGMVNYYYSAVRYMEWAWGPIYCW